MTQSPDSSLTRLILGFKSAIETQIVVLRDLGAKARDPSASTVYLAIALGEISSTVRELGSALTSLKAAAQDLDSALIAPNATAKAQYFTPVFPTGSSTVLCSFNQPCLDTQTTAALLHSVPLPKSLKAPLSLTQDP